MPWIDRYLPGGQHVGGPVYHWSGLVLPLVWNKTITEEMSTATSMNYQNKTNKQGLRWSFSSDIAQAIRFTIQSGYKETTSHEGTGTANNTLFLASLTSWAQSCREACIWVLWWLWGCQWSHSPRRPHRSRSRPSSNPFPLLHGWSLQEMTRHDGNFYGQNKMHPVKHEM